MRLHSWRRRLLRWPCDGETVGWRGGGSGAMAAGALERQRRRHDRDAMEAARVWVEDNWAEGMQ
ncbi:hypothetical protein E2562_013211 [Oryza meyeriana var. granulata]|uniref:Uncharacterized protein n=1 Tax=Oryza meyeriana var. granulata TaxID=110450 RepID=A0A6G1D319_9ORYZ|nr:hypothetical protein E2562_013211 [Oryza meyeriana var. granulata]